MVVSGASFPVWFEPVADETQLHNYVAAKKLYDDAYAMWIASGRRGPAPPRPVKPHIPGWNPDIPDVTHTPLTLE